MDLLEHRIEALKHLHSPESQNCHVLGTQKLVALLVARRACRPIMELAVHFDRKPRFITIEVNDIWSDGVLPPESEANGAATEP